MKVIKEEIEMKQNEIEELRQKYDGAEHSPHQQTIYALSIDLKLKEIKALEGILKRLETEGL